MKFSKVACPGYYVTYLYCHLLRPIRNTYVLWWLLLTRMLSSSFELFNVTLRPICANALGAHSGQRSYKNNAQVPTLDWVGIKVMLKVLNHG